MFSSLGLFGAARCPEEACSRPNCFFSHGAVSNRSNERRTSFTSTTGAVKRKVEVNPGPLPHPKKSREAAEAVQEAKKASVHVGNAPTASSATPKESASAPKKPAPPITRRPPAPQPPTKSLASSSECPRLMTAKKSPHPYPDRQKGLQTLFTQFHKLYADVLTRKPTLAQESAVEQEEELSTSSPNLAAYKRNIHQAAVSISRRPKPDSFPHPSIGTVKESRRAYEEAEKASTSRLTRARIAKYCLSHEDMLKWRYPDPLDMDLTSDEDVGPSAEGTEQTCDRCKVPYTVSSASLASRFGECRFHYGRTAPERVEGKRKWIYSCCRRERGETGCTEGLHVFNEKEDDARLAKRVPFKTVKQVLQAAEGSMREGGALDVVAMDCEMISTTGGSSLARLSIVDENGNSLLDELVRQTIPVIDLNTRFSGVKPGQLDGAVMDLPAIRTAACSFIGPETVIVGHGLENDLRALRLLHDKVIDTAIVFPHDKGHPYRRALRDIVKEKLGVFIQDRTADLGHSSAEDAKATLDLLKWKVREDVTS